MTAKSPSSLSRLVRAAVGGLALLGLGGGATAGCLARDVEASNPQTTNVVVTQIKQTAVDKIDLLFMIDNSISMADKQTTLAAAVPELVGRLVDPICVNDDGTQTAPATGGTCPPGMKQEFAPIRNINIGVVTSSLGSHGSDFTCAEAKDNDFARMLGTVRNPAPPSNTSFGFLFWGPGNGGEADVTTLISNFTQHVTGAGEEGCGYEASLEAWFRFLVDPFPPRNVRAEAQQNGTFVVVDRNPDGTIIPDDVILQQRAAFLRPDSLVAIVMLTDENDCSIMDAGQSQFVGNSQRLWRSSAACEVNPNDRCCYTCALEAPSGCTPKAQDAACSRGIVLSDEEDTQNLRCWEMKRRFGIDFLYPTARYVTGLKSPILCPYAPYNDMDCTCSYGKSLGDADCDRRVGPQVANPLYAGGTRGSDLVFLAGIVGVPWQLIATSDTRNDPNRLSYLRAVPKEPGGESLADRWDAIVGDVNRGVRPTSGFMVESVAKRLGFAPDPYTNLAPNDFGASNPINGNEYDIVGFDDLQYACVFPLPASTDCGSGRRGCDCGLNETDRAQKPLCQTGTTLQVNAKAYPGLRQLQVLKDYGENSIVASICPKIASTATGNPDRGYNPAVAAIIDRLKDQLTAKCLPRKLATDPVTGNVQCRLVETAPPSGGGCSCNIELRTEADPAVAAAVRQQLQSLGLCGVAGQPKCEEYCLCEYEQPDPDAAEFCRTSSDLQGPKPAWCYIDDSAGLCDGSASEPQYCQLIANCRPTERQVLRLISSSSVSVPLRDATLFVACLGANL